jgi:hypothetical protein
MTRPASARRLVQASSARPQLAYWQRIPAANSPTSFLIDKLGPGDDIEDTKPILAETAEFLLGKPITVLIDRGRRQAAT